MKCNYIVLFVSVLTATLAFTAPPQIIENTPGSIKAIYRFDSPAITAKSLKVSPNQGVEFDLVTIQDCRLIANPGEPKLPLKTVRFLLPQNHVVEQISVTGEVPKTVPGQLRLMPAQMESPLSSPVTPPFIEPIPAIYESNDPYPSKPYMDVQYQSFRGYRMVIFNVCPLVYYPKSGKAITYGQMKIEVTTKPGTWPTDMVSLRGLAKDIAQVRTLVDNPDMVDSYAVPKAGSKTTYDYLIITNSTLLNSTATYKIQDLVNHKNVFGISTHIETVGNIYASTSGTDNPDKIRNYIKSAYQNWNVEWVLLVGDADGADVGGESGDNIVPTRGFYANGYGEIDTNIPCDMYYSCLDGSFDNDGDGRYGERFDGPNGGEVDFYGEVYVGRACVDTRTELSNFIHKLITYETWDAQDAYLKRALMVGELLWNDPTYGGDSKDEIKTGSCTHGYCTFGIPNDWTVGTMYDRDMVPDWSKQTLINVLNSSVYHVVNHLGHSNVNYCMRMFNSDADALTNSKPFFAYSQGCYDGSFDNRGDSGSNDFLNYDCICEHFVNNDRGPFAFVGNSRYGWGEHQSTDGSSQYFDRQFFDAVFGEGLLSLGRANQDSKEDNVGYMNYGANRWVAYELNLFGCPQTRLGANLSSIGSIDLGNDMYKSGNAVNITVIDRDLNLSPSANDTATVTVTTDSGDSESVTLTETGPFTCIFSGQITIDANAGAANDGTLNCTSLDRLTATYIDADDGQGNVNTPRTATAEIDAQPPIISNVQISNITENAVRITWTTDEPANGVIFYDSSPPLSQTEEDWTLSTNHILDIDNLSMCTTYHFDVTSRDFIGNVGVDNNYGQSYEFTTLHKDTVYLLNETMDSAPGWAVSGGSGQYSWQWGIPQGQGGEHGNPDPTSGYTGNYVMGYNLAGDYQNNMGSIEYVTLPPVDCTTSVNTKFGFWRWLGLEEISYDHGSIEITTDGASWHVLWENDATIEDSAWTYQQFDISAYADGESSVQIRFGMGPTDGGWHYCGWNLDDVAIFYERFTTCGTITPTATPTPTMTGIATATPTPTFAVVPNPPDVIQEPVYTGGSTNTIEWVPGSINSHEFLVQVSNIFLFTNIIDSSGWISATSYTTTNLQHGKTYYYRVKARNGVGESNWSRSVYSTQDALKPQILLGGFWNSEISNVQGGTFTVLAFITDTNVERVEVYENGVTMGYQLNDEGLNGDIQADDGLFMAVENMAPGMVAGNHYLTIVAEDRAGNVCEWPMLTVPDESNTLNAVNDLPVVIEAERKLLQTRYALSSLVRESVHRKAANTDGPVIMAGGYWDTELSYQSGGTLKLLALVQSSWRVPNIDTVEIYFMGVGTGLFLEDDGQHDDFAANDGLYGFTYNFAPMAFLPGEYVLELVATDTNGNSSSIYPYMFINAQ